MGRYEELKELKRDLKQNGFQYRADIDPELKRERWHHSIPLLRRRCVLCDRRIRGTAWLIVGLEMGCYGWVYLTSYACLNREQCRANARGMAVEVVARKDRAWADSEVRKARWRVEQDALFDAASKELP